MICEFCLQEHDGKYGSGRFCSEHCSRLFAINKNNQKDKFIKGICKHCNNEFLVKRGTAKEWYICDNCKESHYGSVKRVSTRIRVKLICGCGKEDFKLVPKPEVSRYIANYKCNLCKAIINRESKLKYYSELPWDKAGYGIRYRKILQEQNNKCLICNISDWNSKPIRLHLDHIDGNHSNNQRDNLRLICPNCHSQTETYCRSQTGKKLTDSEIAEAIIKNECDITKAIISLGLSNGGQNVVRFRKIYKRIIDNGEINGQVAKLADA